jgi:SAM-dependent methyltransferase
MSESAESGVLGAGYASDRARRKHVAFRALARARLAVEVFEERHARVEPVHVLDLGAAEGLTLAEMRRLLGGRGDTLGVEASEPLVRLAVPGVELVMDPPPRVPAGHFHLCTALAVLEHLPSPERAVRAAFRSLRPGGVFVASCPHPGWEAVATRLGLFADDSHQQQLSLGALSRLLAAEGFERVETRRFMFAPVAFLPYLGLGVGSRFASRVDARVRASGLLEFGFVNQAVFAQKPAG